MDTIIFDVDDTLYDQTIPFKKAFREKFQEAFTDREIEKIFIASRKYGDLLSVKYQAGEISLLNMQKNRIIVPFDEFGIRMADHQAVEFQETYLAEQQKITLFTEIKELLDVLSNQAKQLAVLTNGDEDHQSMKIKQLNLEKWIPKEHIFISGSIGHAKPKFEVFDYIKEKLQLDKTKTVYIGDSFENDIVGAKQAGWHAIWMNHRKRDVPSTTDKPDKTVYNAKELLNLFNRKHEGGF